MSARLFCKAGRRCCSKVSKDDPVYKLAKNENGLAGKLAGLHGNDQSVEVYLHITQAPEALVANAQKAIDHLTPGHYKALVDVISKELTEAAYSKDATATDHARLRGDLQLGR